ncbi:hypothetical protein J4212_06385 [Candidatus Woesearchaeota archaeon]|nr:hypothetical protein [Candidatus Woesearchaeota archaeon]
MRNGSIQYEFLVPIFFLKNHDSEISKIDYKDNIGPQYRFTIDPMNRDFYLRLLKNKYLNISRYLGGVMSFKNKDIIDEHESEKQKFLSLKRDKEELLRKLGKL